MDVCITLVSRDSLDALSLLFDQPVSIWHSDVEDGGPIPEAGDQIAAIFKGNVVGLFTFTSETGTDSYEILVFGDNPSTNEVEGPKFGQIITFGFFDSSRNIQRENVVALNQRGESIRLRFEGEEVLAIPGLPFDFTPTPDGPIDLRLNVEDNSSGGGGGGGGTGTPSGQFDIDADGKVTTRDAAAVLRVVVGAKRGLTSEQLKSADVNGDGTVDTNDAIEILRNR